MKTHSLKLNGDKSGHIVTLTPEFMGKLRTAKHDLAVRATIEYLKKRIKQLTGKPVSLYYEQEIELKAFVDSITKPTNNALHSRAQALIRDGYMCNECYDAVELFDLLNAMYSIMQEHMV